MKTVSHKAMVNIIGMTAVSIVGLLIKGTNMAKESCLESINRTARRDGYSMKANLKMMRDMAEGKLNGQMAITTFAIFTMTKGMAKEK